ncbi:MAG: type III pantothenate kinase [Oscillospiraceae bacterium]|nr:type III pantothenate kinase [Oscillospiraceae bacterium]
MILTVDIGNTNLKIGAWDNERLAFVSRIVSDAMRTDDEYAIHILDAFRLNDCNSNQFDGAIIASVVPILSNTLASAVSKVIPTTRIFQVGPGLKTGLNIKIDNPAQLGADMVCAAVSAVARYPLPCIICNLGTATAIFAIGSNGDFLGCSVAPGLIISLDALAHRTAQLPHISLDNPPKNVIGTNTDDSMKSGAIYGAAAMLDGMVDRFREQLGENAAVIACGGLAKYVYAHCKQEIIYDDHLIMDGLRIIYFKNVK